MTATPLCGCRVGTRTFSPAMAPLYLAWYLAGVPHLGTEDPRCKPRPVTVPGKGSYVKVVNREGTQGNQMVIIGTISIQKEKAEVPNLNISTLAAVRAPDESSETDEEYNEELAEMALGRSGGVEPAAQNAATETLCSGCLGGADPAEPSALVASRLQDHRLPHKPTDPDARLALEGR